MKYLLTILILTIPFAMYSQECDCELNFKWLKKTFEENDAGFSYVIKEKGNESYKAHNEIFAQKVKNISDQLECAEAMNEWLSFFRLGHLSIKPIVDEYISKLSKEKIIEQFKDWEKTNVDIEQFKIYIQSRNIQDYEGIWTVGSSSVGIKKVNDSYLGFIIDSDGVYWKEGQVKLKIHADNSVTYYMKNHSAKHFDNAELLGRNYLLMGFITLKRTDPVFESEPEVNQYIEKMKIYDPYFEKIDKNTVMLRIPRFYGSDIKPKIDSVISTNKSLILASKNLIVDIRNNGGGADRSYKEIIPFLYTNPIRTIGVEYLSTALNNQRMLDFISDEKYGFNEEEKKWAQVSYEKLSKGEGEFVNLDSTDVTIDILDTVYPNPQNIGIIINENNGSTAEQFLLAAKQSKKVKLFGTTTSGILDISNMYFVKSPSGEFELGYSLTRSMRIPDMAIDNKGIQPDYYIDKSVPKYKWIEFVTEIIDE
jgi:hypothetical protein